MQGEDAAVVSQEEGLQVHKGGWGVVKHEGERRRRCALEGDSQRKEQQAPGVLEHSSVPSPRETLQQVASVW